MKTKIRFSLLLAAAMVVIAGYSCSKQKASRSGDRVKEEILYEDQGDWTQYSPFDLALGANVKRVSAIRFDNPVMDIVKISQEWKDATAELALDLENITRTYVHSTDISLVTIPVKSDGRENQYVNIYVGKENFLITRFSELHERGLTTCKIQSSKGELYYQFDLNGNNQVGNWKFGQDLPKMSDDRTMNTAGREPAPTPACNKKKFNSCMNCLIIDVCGSDWICTIACGLAIPSCIGGAALFCMIV